MNMMKDLLLMSLREKAGKINWEELGSNATFLPVIYFVVMAPGFLMLLGLCCLLTAALGKETELFIQLGSCLITCSLILIGIYRLMIKRQFKFRKKSIVETSEKLPPSPIDHFIAPFLVQIRQEQEMLLRKNN